MEVRVSGLGDAGHPDVALRVDEVDFVFDFALVRRRVPAANQTASKSNCVKSNSAKLEPFEPLCGGVITPVSCSDTARVGCICSHSCIRSYDSICSYIVVYG